MDIWKSLEEISHSYLQDRILEKKNNLWKSHNILDTIIILISQLPNF